MRAMGSGFGFLGLGRGVQVVRRDEIYWFWV
jgi:hypothetical protein